MNRHTRRVAISMAAVVLAGLGLAAPRPAGAQYAFSSVDFPGATLTDVLGFTPQTMVGQFFDADGNTHGWLFPAKSGQFEQFDVPGAWSTSLSAINHTGDFGGVYRDDPAHPLRRHGFLVVQDVLTIIDYPGSTRTSIVQMNNRGQAVGIGRPYAWGLGAFGQPGVERVLELLRIELRAIMQQVGAPTIKHLVPAMVRRV